ncbi:MAG: response regulator [Herminiimonas sp.]|nr:response regulator [Herminiimonas sp.]
MQSFADLTVLLIEPHAGMRASMHNMLNQCGVGKIEHAVSAGSAMRPIRGREYDIILCEYDLGEGQDGQQLLEDLRHNNMIPLSTIFFMVTAERSYQKVVSAAELAPTDYILKPCTADIVLDRITRAIERRAQFLPVYRLMEQGSLRQAVDACIEGEACDKRYAFDFMRLRAELHVILGEPALAEPIYAGLFEARAVAWARLGLAKSLFMQDRLDEAQNLLSVLVDQNRNFLDAYDWLAKTHEANGHLPQAQSVLQEATAISPHAVRRLRKLGDIAFQTGDVETAERAFTQVVSRARYSEFRNPEDHVRLVRSLVAKGDTQQAASVIRDLNKTMGGNRKTDTCSALSASMVHAHTGDTARAVEELGKAVDACRDSVGMSAEMKMALAQQCLAHDLEDGATEIMTDVMSNAPDSRAQARAMAIFEQAGRRDLADSVSKQSRQRVVDLVSAGAEKAKKGDFKGAVLLMTEAATKLPDNPQVIFNAAVAVLKCLENLGWDGKLGEQARGYIEKARALDPTNPRLAPLAELYQMITRKYGIAQMPAASRSAR